MFGTGGLQYVGGDRSIQRGSNMHDLYFGLYSRGGTLVYYKHEIHTDFPAKRRKYFH